MSTTRELIPLFGGSKLPMNNEILIPGAMYLSTNAIYLGGWSYGPPWRRKRNAVVCRGTASGGRKWPDSWRHFHRHRLVEMLNGTAVEEAEVGDGLLTTGPLPSPDQYDVARRREGRLSAWLSSLTDASFNDRNCFLYGLLGFFSGDRKGDAAARLLAETGKAWAKVVLRRDDMLLYTWRALLEFARVCDEARETPGFVENLVKGDLRVHSH
ncbi:capsule associated protein [Grosmannia clavigera kw1407]|uniref:Capsule associated protein n=1 Tax=Grosmannia clavigera (strain kw1407 / UAMH 11150) TaxID=655863 RepID=F0XV54_GROCL|nr:capsule associated protein [Grosmannia clavigera kw1407]EFW98585.1 capsule associated protein [Grosmannia clavigera kw1407]